MVRKYNEHLIYNRNKRPALTTGSPKGKKWPLNLYFCVMTWQLILGLTIPSLMVFLAVYFTFRQYHQQQIRMHYLQSKTGKDHITLPMRLHAYERLILLCERIDFADLMLRMITPGTSAREIRAAMLVAVQQEYEHNLTQQLYITPELWQVLLAAKNKTMDVISLAGENLSEGASAEDYAQQLMEMISSETSLPAHIGKKAIKTESAIWL